MYEKINLDKEKFFDKIVLKGSDKMKNIILIGMPGAGKSTIGVILAKTLRMDFVDTDLIIQNSENKKLIEIINDSGIDGFLKAENEVLKNISLKNTVIATGGSAVYSKEGMDNLKQNGTTVYLYLEKNEIEKRIKNIKTRGIVMDKNQTLNELFIERESLYKRYADLIVDCNSLTLEESVEKVIEYIKSKDV